MVKYILKRALISAAAILLVITVSFFLLHSLPGNPFASLSSMNRDMQQRIMSYYGLDQPLLKQFAAYMQGLFRGDLGYSLQYLGQPVNEIIARSFPYSFQLGLQAYLFGVPLGVLLGIVSTRKKGGTLDSLIVVGTTLGTTIPVFILGALLQYVFAIRLGWFAIARWSGFSSTLLPSLTMSIGVIAGKARMMRTCMLETRSETYLLTAYAKGLPRLRVILTHQVRNALIPVISTMGIEFAGIIMGSFVVEQIYSIPGLGSYYVLAIQNLDYTVVLGLTIFYSIFVVAANFAVDIAYGLIDPRIRIQG